MSSPPPEYQVTANKKSSADQKSTKNEKSSADQKSTPNQWIAHDTINGSDEDVPPPAYGDIYGELDEDRNGVATSAVVAGLYSN